MKYICKTSTKIMNKMINMMVNGYLKIDNAKDSFMPVVLEEISDNGNYKIISMAHYYEQNGDLLVDPEMMFIYYISQNVFVPYYFKQDGILSMEQDSIKFKDVEINSICPKMQADHTTFANQWIRNIKYQQNL